MSNPVELLVPLGLRRTYERECIRVPGLQRVTQRFCEHISRAPGLDTHITPALALYVALRDASLRPCPLQALEHVVSTLAVELDLATHDSRPRHLRLGELRQALLAPYPEASNS